MAFADIEKKRAYQRAWMKARRVEFFGGKRCLKCGSVEQLELDHIDPSQKLDHKIWGWAKERREAEIAKCQILCRSCHQIKSKQDMGYQLVHGTETGYRNYRCRCPPCKDAHAAVLRRYRDPARRRARLARALARVYKPSLLSTQREIKEETAEPRAS